MQKIMEQPEVKAKMEETRKEQSQLRDREYAMVYKAMDRRQVATFKRMLGKPFDVDSVTAGFFRGGPGGPGRRTAKRCQWQRQPDHGSGQSRYRQDGARGQR